MNKSTSLLRPEEVAQLREHKTYKAPEEKLRHYWHYYAERGCELLTKNNDQQAQRYLSECVEIGQVLLKEKSTKTELSGLELFYIATHNLASSHNKLNQAARALDLLAKIHEVVLLLCKNTNMDLQLRQEALSVLDKSLFSLISQLANMGKLDAIYPLIRSTEEEASRLQQELKLTAHPHRSTAEV